MSKRIFLVPALAGCVIASSAFGQTTPATLTVGDLAPQLADHVKWIKGEPVTEFQKGHIYLLDFWATWCGPCVASIPHTSELADQYKDDDVHVIGVAVFARPGMAPVNEFVEQRGDEIRYAIAEDANEDIERLYMDTTKTYSIPTVMIVDREGYLAWIGNPYEGLDKALKRIVDGEFNAKLQGKAMKLLRKANELASGGDWDQSLTIVDQVVELDSKAFALYAVRKYQVLLVRLGEAEKASKYGRKIVGTYLAENADQLNNLAWFIATGDVAEPDYKLAMDAITRANKLTKGADADVLETLAAVQHASGDLKEAIKTQKKALEIAQNEKMRTTMQETLAKYEGELDE